MGGVVVPGGDLVAEDGQHEEEQGFGELGFLGVVEDGEGEGDYFGQTALDVLAVGGQKHCPQGPQVSVGLHLLQLLLLSVDPLPVPILAHNIAIRIHLHNLEQPIHKLLRILTE